jgi:hypothetical protein
VLTPQNFLEENRVQVLLKNVHRAEYWLRLFGSFIFHVLFIFLFCCWGVAQKWKTANK